MNAELKKRILKILERRYEQICDPCDPEAYEIKDLTKSVKRSLRFGFERQGSFFQENLDAKRQ